MAKNTIVQHDPPLNTSHHLAQNSCSCNDFSKQGTTWKTVEKIPTSLGENMSSKHTHISSKYLKNRELLAEHKTDRQVQLDSESDSVVQKQFDIALLKCESISSTSGCCITPHEHDIPLYDVEYKDVIVY